VSRSFELPDVEWATVGTVGPPGQRVFYLQARQGDEQITLKLEKQQVAAIAQFLGEILSDLPVADSLPDDDAMALTEPVEAEWAVGGLQLAYDTEADRIVIVAEEIGDDDTEDTDDPPEPDYPSGIGDPASGPDFGDPSSGGDPAVDRGMGRLSLTRTQAAAIVRRGWDLVSAGRPTCALCGRPIDPDGHSCPRTNGHGPPAA
jgi:uncharacterized repeat protein (TIGR03847 family)